MKALFLFLVASAAAAQVPYYPGNGALPATNTPNLTCLSTGVGGNCTWQTPPSGPPSGAAAGALTGSYPNPSIASPLNLQSIQGMVLANSFSGGDIVTKINAAFASCGSTPTCVVGVLPGTYAPPGSGTSPTLTMTSPVTQRLVGLGSQGSVVIQSNVASGADAVLFKAANFRTYFQQATNTSGGIENITFINTVAGSNGLHTGNVIGSFMLNDVFTNSSTAGGNACIWIDNSLDNEGSPFAGFYERNRWIHVQAGNPTASGTGGCTYGVYAKQNGGTNSLEYNNLDMMFNLSPGQFGLYLDGSGSTSGSPLELQNGTLNIFANVSSSSTQTATNPEVISVTANSTIAGEFTSVSGENNPITGQTTSALFANGVHVYSGGSYATCGGSENFRVMQDVGGPITTYCSGALPNSISIYGENVAGTGSLSMLTIDTTNAVRIGGSGGTGGAPRLFYLTATCAATSGAPDCQSTPFEFDAAVWSGTASVLNDWRLVATSSYVNNASSYNILPVNQPSNITDFFVGVPALKFIPQMTQVQGTCNAAREWEIYPVSGTPDLTQICLQTATPGTYAWATISTASAAVASVFGRTGAVVAASGDYTAAQVTNAAATNTSNTFTAGGQTNSANGAASAPAQIMSGQPYTAGTASTNYPLFYFNCSGSTAPSTWNTGGTWLGFNLCSGFTGNTSVIDIHDNGGASVFQLLGNGAFTTASSVTGASIKINGTQSSVSCSTSGTAVFSQPIQGTTDKKVLVHMAACLGTASYTYPTAFTNAPSVYASNNVAASIATSVSNTAVTVTGATTTGSLVLEDY